MNRVLSLWVVVATALMAPLPALSACTIFTAHNGDVVMAGNNEDWTEWESWIWFVPAVENSYGMVLTGFENFYAQGGMNDKGLFYDWYAGFGSRLTPEQPGKKHLRRDGPPLNFGEEALATCQTVAQALKLLNDYYVPDLGYAQILLADRSGQSAAARWDWTKNRLLVERPKENYQAIGVRGETVGRAFAQDNRTITFERFRDLAALAVTPRYTVYTTVYDLRSGDMQLYYRANYSDVRSWNVYEELRKGSYRLRMMSLFHRGE